MEITKLAEVADVLGDMQSNGIIGEYAVGGAVAAVLHSQPISEKWKAIQGGLSHEYRF